MLKAKVFMILIVPFKKHLFFLLTNELKLMNFSVPDKIFFIQQFKWLTVYSLDYCLSLWKKIIIVVFYKFILKLLGGPERISYQFYKDKPTQLQILKMAKRQLMITTYNFNLYQNKIMKIKGGNIHKSIKSESFVSGREAMKMWCRKSLKIRHFKNLATSTINFDKLKSKHIYIAFRFNSEKVNQLHVNKQIFEQFVQSKLNKTTKKYYKLIDISLDYDFLEKCYFCIKSKSGNLTLSVEKRMHAYINKIWFKKIFEDIKSGFYTPKPNRVVYIFKSNSHEKGRLITNSLKDKIIQEGFRRILSTIYESKFSKYSYGYRKNKNVHHALKQVKYWKDVSWFICLDIEKRFDSINRIRLISILKKV
jgi:hypothetical protein